MSPRKTMIGILAAGAASLTLAAGLSTSAAATPEEPKSKTCVEATQQWREAKDKEAAAKGKRDAAKTEHTAAVKDRDDAKAAAIKPGSPPEPDADTAKDNGAQVTPAEQEAIDRQQRRVDIEKGQLETAQADYDKAKATTAKKQAAANEACKGSDGKPGETGKPGEPGAPGLPGAPGAPGQPAPNPPAASGGNGGGSETNTQNNYYRSPPTAGESVVESDLVVTH